MRLLDTEAPVLAACLALLELRGIPAYRSDAACVRPAGCIWSSPTSPSWPAGST
jgi:hypothetical protein